MNNLFEKLLELLYPFDIRCSLCKSEMDMGLGLGICGKCADGLDRNTRVEELDGMECFGMLGYYDDVRKMIVNLKFNGKKHFARTLGVLAADSLMGLGWQADALVPVPIHPRRRRKRGYNQSELIARTLSELSGIPLKPGLLRRVRDTKPQTSLSGEERKTNLADAFVAQIEDYNSILLLDDVLTTGSTLTECGRAVRATGAKCRGFAIARA